MASQGPGIFGDFDNDGYPDLYVYPKQQLFKSDRGREFTEVAILVVGRLSMEGPTLGIHPAIAARNLSLRHHLA